MKQKYGRRASLLPCKCIDLGGIVYGMQFTYNGYISILDTKFFAASFIGYTLPYATYYNGDVDLMLKSSLPIEIKVKITIDDIRRRSNLTTIKL